MSEKGHAAALYDMEECLEEGEGVSWSTMITIMIKRKLPFSYSKPRGNMATAWVNSSSRTGEFIT
jgi:hypothetical protein